MTSNVFHIDLTETFEHLPNAPIVEAVIHWRARAESIDDPEEFYKRLKERLKDYPSSQPQHEIEFQAKVGSVGMATTVNRPNWSGFKFTSADERHIAQFMRDGFAFSRLRPYQNWDCFESEAQRLWWMYLELAKPTEIQRLGVRFINAIPIRRIEELERLLVVPPKSPSGMVVPLTNFTHQNTFAIPESACNLNVIQTVQPTSPMESGSAQLILDIDVFTTQVPEIDEESIKHQLSEIRWIKNKVFFSFFTQSAINKFRETS